MYARETERVNGGGPEKTINRGIIVGIITAGMTEGEREAKIERRDQRVRVINTIIKGRVASGSISKGKKIYVRMVLTAEMSSKKTREQIPAITFYQSNLEGIHCSYDDALVVTVNIDEYEVKRIVIDTSSFADLLYYEAFKDMNIPNDKLLPIDVSIK